VNKQKYMISQLMHSSSCQKSVQVQYSPGVAVAVLQNAARKDELNHTHLDGDLKVMRERSYNSYNSSIHTNSSPTHKKLRCWCEATKLLFMTDL
jgi:hypothetical protein